MRGHRKYTPLRSWMSSNRNVDDVTMRTWLLHSFNTNKWCDAHYSFLFFFGLYFGHSYRFRFMFHTSSMLTISMKWLLCSFAGSHIQFGFEGGVSFWLLSFFSLSFSSFTRSFGLIAIWEVLITMPEYALSFVQTSNVKWYITYKSDAFSFGADVCATTFTHSNLHCDNVEKMKMIVRHEW